MKHRLKWGKVSMEFNESSNKFRVKSPKLIGRKDVHEFYLSDLQRVVVGVGSLATMGCGVEWSGGQFWVPTPFRRDQEAARMLLQVVAQKGSLVKLEDSELDGFLLGYKKYN